MSGEGLILGAPAAGLTPLRSLRGDVERGRPEIDIRVGGTLHGRVRVVPLDRGRLGLEVLAEWRGPGLPDLPPIDGGVEAADVLVLDRLETARAVTQAAADELRAGRAPNLRALHARLRHGA